MIEKKSGHTNGEWRRALFSDSQEYRLLLDILWDYPAKALMTTIGLNPSTATELTDDATIRRAKRYARDWGFGGLRMLNAFAWRDTDPRSLFIVPDPIGPDNTIDFLKSNATETTLAMWGVTITSRAWKHRYRGHDIAAVIPNIKAFRLTSDGHPEHCLRLPLNLRPISFSYEDDAMHDNWPTDLRTI